MELIINILYFAFFLIGTLICLKLLLASNLEKVFKQGKVFEIRIAYLILAFIGGFLFASSIVKLIEVLYSLISF